MWKPLSANASEYLSFTPTAKWADAALEFSPSTSAHWLYSNHLSLERLFSDPERLDVAKGIYRTLSRYDQAKRLSSALPRAEGRSVDPVPYAVEVLYLLQKLGLELNSDTDTAQAVPNQAGSEPDTTYEHSIYGEAIKAYSTLNQVLASQNSDDREAEAQHSVIKILQALAWKIELWIRVSKEHSLVNPAPPDPTGKRSHCCGACYQNLELRINLADVSPHNPLKTLSVSTEQQRSTSSPFSSAHRGTKTRAQLRVRIEGSPPIPDTNHFGPASLDSFKALGSSVESESAGPRKPLEFGGPAKDRSLANSGELGSHAGSPNLGSPSERGGRLGSASLGDPWPASLVGTINDLPGGVQVDDIRQVPGHILASAQGLWNPFQNVTSHAPIFEYAAEEQVVPCQVLQMSEPQAMSHGTDHVANLMYVLHEPHILSKILGKKLDLPTVHTS